MRHPIAKLTKMVRDLATTAYHDNGQLMSKVSDTHAAAGMYRSVQIEDEMVVKFARNTCHAGHNKAEWAVYHRMSKDLREVTAKPLCISSCGKVMAMELIPETLRQRANDGRIGICTELEDFNSNLKDLLEASGFSHSEISDLTSDNHPSNVGVRENGDLCWIDYASWGDKY